MLFGKKTQKRSVNGAGQKQPIYSYRGGPKQPAGGHAGQNRWHLWLRRAGLVVALILTGAGVFYSTTLDGSSRIVTKGDTRLLRDTGIYGQKADEILGSSVKNKSKLTVDKADIAEQMKAQFPELATVNIATPPWFHQPIFELTLHGTALIFTSSGDKLAINPTGVAIFEQSQDSLKLEGLNVPEITDQTGYQPELGRQVLSAAQVDFILEVDFQLKEKKIEIDKYLLKPGGSELHIVLRGQKYLIKLNTQAEGRESAGAFLAVQQRLEREGKTPRQYIDVRLPERVYIK
jgi:hypothetical protein